MKNQTWSYMRLDARARADYPVSMTESVSTNDKLRARITVNADQMGGVPCLRGLRVPVATVIGMVASGMNEQEILEDYPYLEVEDIRAALRHSDTS